MFLVDILIYILSIALCFCLLAIATVFYVSIKEWIRVSKKKKQLKEKKKRLEEKINVRDN